MKDLINEWFEYKRGRLFWIKSPNQFYKAGMPASTSGARGYRAIRLKGKSYREHRLIWILHFGEIPEGLEIDHIDRNRSNNNIENLRVVTHAQNVANSSVRNTSKSGIRGVSKTKTGKWVARITTGLHYLHLGTFDTKEEAAEAYNKLNNAKLEYQKSIVPKHLLFQSGVHSEA
jgi:hypothetical protein